MNTTSTRIVNRRGLSIASVLDMPDHPAGLAFVQHGLGGFKEQDHIRSIAGAFSDNGYAVVRFDTTNSIGESDGDMSKVTALQSAEDLEDVIAWAKMREWYQEPFALAGHSLGGLSVLLYAEAHPSEVKLLAPISALVSGELYFTSPDFRKIHKAWEEVGWYIKESRSKPGVFAKIPWSFNTGLRALSTLPQAHRLTMPVILIVGEHDPLTPYAHQQALYDALPDGHKELHCIQGAVHTYRNADHLKQLQSLIDAWLKRYAKGL